MNDGVLSPDNSSASAGYFRFSVIGNPWDRFISGRDQNSLLQLLRRGRRRIFLRHFGGDGELFEFDF